MVARQGCNNGFFRISSRRRRRHSGSVRVYAGKRSRGNGFDDYRKIVAVRVDRFWNGSNCIVAMIFQHYFFS